MQSDVLNEQQQLSNDTDCSSTTATTLIYSGLKLHPKPLVPTISMPGVASPLSIVKKLSLPDSHLDNNVRHSTSSNSTATTPSSIRLVTPTNKSTSSFQVTDKSSSTNGAFSTSKTYILNPPQSSTTTVNKQQIHPNSNSSSLLTLIPPGTTSPKIQTLNSVTISSTNDMSTIDKSSTNNSNQSVFLSKNRLTFVQPITSSSSSTTNSSPKLVIQQNTNSSTTNNHYWQQPQQTQPTKIFSIPQTAKMLSRPVQLIPTSDHHITHVKTDNPTLMHFGLSSPTTNENPLTKTFDSSGHQAYIHMQLLPSTSNSDLQFTLPSTTHLYSSPSSVLISTTQRSMDHNNNHHHHHHHHQSTITTPIIREIQTEEKLNKNRTRLPLQPSIQQTIRQPKKHKLNDDYSLTSSEPPHKLPHYEQLDSSKKLSKSRHRHFSIENTTPISIGIEPTGITKKSYSPETNLISRKRRTINKLISNENIKQELIPNIIIDQIDDELLRRLSQDFVYMDKRTGIRWIGRKNRPKAMSTLVSRFSWKPKINHYEKYSDIIRTNPKRTIPVKNIDSIRKKLTQPWATWRIDRLTTYLSDLVQDEQMTQNQLSDIPELLDIDDPSIRTTIQDLIEANVQRHRCFCDQLTQISSLLVSLLDHGNTIRDICSIPKSSSTTKRTKER